MFSQRATQQSLRRRKSSLTNLQTTTHLIPQILYFAHLLTIFNSRCWSAITYLTIGNEEARGTCSHWRINAN